MIDLQAIGEVVNSSTTLVGMRNDHDFVTSID